MANSNEIKIKLKGFDFISIDYKKEVEQRGEKIEQGNHLLTLNSIKLN